MCVYIYTYTYSGGGAGNSSSLFASQKLQDMLAYISLDPYFPNKIVRGRVSE
jgi:hypothetical protein